MFFEFEFMGQKIKTVPVVVFSAEDYIAMGKTYILATQQTINEIKFKSGKNDKKSIQNELNEIFISKALSEKLDYYLEHQKTLVNYLAD